MYKSWIYIVTISNMLIMRKNNVKVIGNSNPIYMKGIIRPGVDKIIAGGSMGLQT